MSSSFAILFTLFFLLGTVTFARRRLGVSLFIFGVALLPLGPAYYSLTAFQQIWVSDGFFLSASLAVMFRRNYRRPKKSTDWGSLGFFALAVYLAFGITFDGLSRNILRDLRPFIFAIESILLAKMCHEARRPAPSWCTPKTIAIAAFLGMLATLNLATTAGEATLDQFRLREDNLRRAITAGATLSACLLVSFPLFQRKATTSATAALSYLLALATTLGTASRGLIFSIASSLAIASRSRGNTDHLSISPARVTIGAALAFGLLQLAVYFGDWRIVDSLSLDTLTQQLSTRISPATEILADFTLENWIFGKGIGTSFYIPWFRYRGLSPHSANLDNMYLTLIVKYGLLGGAVILRTFQIALTGQHSPIYKTQTTLLFLLIGLTSTPIYQPLILGFAAAQALAINQKYTTSGR